jgi:hypothetical protein
MSCGDVHATVAVTLMHGGWDVSASNEDNPAVAKVCDFLGKRHVAAYDHQRSNNRKVGSIII